MTAVAVVALGAGLASVARGDAAETSFSRKLADGCEELEVCRELELESERRVRSCWVGCGRAVAEQRMARLLRYRAEERRAVRAHYRERDAAERATQQVAREEALERWRREEAARVNADERERRRVLELERLRQAHAERALAEERRRRVSYLALLGAEGRAERLRRCHAAGAPCDALVLDLVEAADEASEKRDLAELHERALDPEQRAAALERPRTRSTRARTPSASPSANRDHASPSVPASAAPSAEPSVDATPRS